MPLIYTESNLKKGPALDMADLRQKFEGGNTSYFAVSSNPSQDIQKLKDFLCQHDMHILLGMDPKKITLLPELEDYIDSNFELQLGDSNRLRSINFNHHETMQVPLEKGLESHGPDQEQELGSLTSFISESIKNLPNLILDLMERKKLENWQVYKAANMDQKSFLDLLDSPKSVPSKDLLLSLAIALELSLNETAALLARYDLRLSRSSVQDLIIRFFLEEGVADIDVINLALFRHSCPPLQAG